MNGKLNKPAYEQKVATKRHKWNNNCCVDCGIKREVRNNYSANNNPIRSHFYSFDNFQTGTFKYYACGDSVRFNKAIQNEYNEVEYKKDTKPSFSIKNIMNEKFTVNIQETKKVPIKTDYSELLKHPKWQRKRLEIMQRDDFKCRSCEDEENTLHVHHLFYEKGKLPWEYDNKDLVTLCQNCHEAWTAIDKLGYGRDTVYFVVNLMWDLMIPE